MGRDKAFVEVDGIPMVQRVASALHLAGCRPIAVVGGDRAALEALDLDVVPDGWPGEGPLGAVVTALRWSGGATAVVACDLPWLGAATVGSVIAATTGDAAPCDVAVARTDRVEPLCACWLPTALPVLARRFEAGERAVHAVLDQLTVTYVDVDRGALHNVNAPRDLPGTRPTG
jgi:molybdopterin-guanine dinucleotide biosynthesis protein A